MPARFSCQTLRFQRPMINTLVMPCPCQMLIRERSPPGADGCQVLRALAPGLLRVQLGPHAVGIDAPCRSQHVRVPVPLVSAPARRMDGHVNRATLTVCEFLREIDHESPALLCGQLGR